MPRVWVTIVCALGVVAAGLSSGTASAQTPVPPAAIAIPPTAPPAAAEEPSHNPVTRLAIDIGHDYKNYFSKENALWLGIGGVAAAGVHAADDEIHEWALEQDATLAGGEQYGSQWLHIPIAVAWWTLGAAAGSSRHAAAGRDLLRAQISVVSWTYAIKLAANRTRPNGDPHSFPSGHASTSFATAMVLQEHYGWKLGVPAFALATYTATSRVFASQHWASDVVFGAVVGMASGRTVTLKLRETRVSIAPLAVPGGGGVPVTALR